MFLLPALAAGTSDALVIYLSRHFIKEDYELDGEQQDYVSNVSYLVPLAIARLILLLLPLPYHTYTGTAVKYPTLYQLLHFGTLLTVLFHMLSIIMLDPDSLGSFLPTVVDRRIQENSKDLHVVVMRHVWVELTLSFVSTCCHVLLLWHVRSTAQHNSWDSWKRRKKVMYFYAKQQSIRQVKNNNGSSQPQPLQIVQQSNPLQYDEESMSLVDDSSYAFEPTVGNSHVNDDESGLPHQQRRMFPGEDFIQQQMRCISSGGNEFMSELQMRVETARKEWAQRLEDVSNRLSNTSSGGGTSTVVSPSPFLQPTPFRVLLQLFAYEEVLSNSRLDQVFDVDDGVSLTYYVPQLLSFLLHGALQSSLQLEEWILSKCELNVHFAHRCYWFLRAWCLEESSLKRTASASPRDGEGGLRSLSSSRNNSSASLHSLGLDPQLENEQPGPLSASRRFPSFGSLPSDASGLDRPTSKLDPEEQSLIEGLMFRVMERGEQSAYALHCSQGYAQEEESDENVRQPQQLLAGEQGTDANKDAPLDSSQAIAASGFMPVDPNCGFPTVRHLDSVSAKQKIGFMPLNARRESWMLTNDGTFFDMTPGFLDMLTSVADNLFTLPRERRTVELRRQLRQMEVEFLPGNSIYMPIGNMHHRVWRIVADESIAISTKERVPCIVCLEVVDYNKKKRHTRKRGFLENALLRTNKSEMQQPHQEQQQENEPTMSSNMSLPLGNPGGKIQMLLPGQSPSLTERETINLWQKSLRPPHRHDSLLEKVTTFTQSRLRKLVDHGSQDVMFWGNGGEGGSWNDLLKIPSAKNRAQTNGGPDVDSEVASLTANMDSDRRLSPAPKPPLAPTLSGTPRSSPPPSVSMLKTFTLSEASSAPSSRHSSRPSSPATTMGQWAQDSPSTEKKPLSDDVANALTSVSDDMEKDNAEIGSLGPLNGSSNGSLRGSVENAAAYGATKDPKGMDDHLDDQQILSGIKVGDSIQSDPTDLTPSKKRRRRPPPVVFKESWSSKQERIREKSAIGSHPRWRLLPILIKPNDDLRQEQLASQLIYRMASILAREKVPVWLCPYEIVALTDQSGIVEAIPDTISIDSLKRNDSSFTTLSNFFTSHFGQGTDEHADAKANFVESLAAYSIACYLLQIKDRHNGNILLDNRGHLIHIDFGFFFLSSPGKNSGFESAPFKLTRDFVDLMDGPESNTFRTFRELCCRTFLSLRRHCYEITLLVEMLMVGNEDLSCFRGRPEDAVRGLRERFRLDLNDRACMEYVNELVDESLVSWRTRWYDRYQRFCVGVL